MAARLLRSTTSASSPSTAGTSAARAIAVPTILPFSRTTGTRTHRLAFTRRRALTLSGRGRPLGLGLQRLHRQPQASALIAIDELHRDVVTLLYHVFGLLGPPVPHLRNV